MQKQIDEVMDLVEKYGHHVVKLNEAKSNADIANALAVTDENMNLIESKLRELLPVWIPVTERLPELGQEVLAGYSYEDTWLKGNPTVFSIGVCSMYEYPNDPCFPQGKRWKTHGCSHSDISHWMPLPKAPE